MASSSPAWRRLLARRSPTKYPTSKMAMRPVMSPMISAGVIFCFGSAAVARMLFTGGASHPPANASVTTVFLAAEHLGFIRHPPGKTARISATGGGGCWIDPRLNESAAESGNGVPMHFQSAGDRRAAVAGSASNVSKRAVPASWLPPSSRCRPRHSPPQQFRFLDCTSGAGKAHTDPNLRKQGATHSRLAVRVLTAVASLPMPAVCVRRGDDHDHSAHKASGPGR
jgi:hypothetical protein